MNSQNWWMDLSRPIQACVSGEQGCTGTWVGLPWVFGCRLVHICCLWSPPGKEKEKKKKEQLSHLTSTWWKQPGVNTTAHQLAQFRLNVSWGSSRRNCLESVISETTGSTSRKSHTSARDKHVSLSNGLVSALIILLARLATQMGIINFHCT